MFLLFAFAAVAHASGSGWVQAIGAVTAGLAVVGILGPALIVRRLNVTCVECLRDGTTGEPFSMSLVANYPLRCTPSRPDGEPTVIPDGEQVSVTMTPPSRGVLASVRVRVATAAPLGLLWWSVERVVKLPQTVEISPDVSHGTVFGSESLGDEEGRGRPVPALTGDLRGVRAYRHGDSRRRVHWQATAHTRSLMVRESEESPDNPVRIVAELSDDPASAELEAADIMGAVANLLRAGKRVELETIEHGERVSGLVSDGRRAGRRLARAGVNPYADLPTA